MTAAAVLISTHKVAARYVPLVRLALRAFWPEAPPIRFISDGGIEPADDVYIEPEPRFVPLMLCGLARLQVEFPNVRHVFHMLEDHCPLRRCDGERISALLSIVRDRDLAAVSFPTYSWPWNKTEYIDYPDGKVRTWRRIDTVEIDGEAFARVPRNFFRYFQVQPTIWRIPYLVNACDEARAAGVFDPWGFEAMQFPNSDQHYVSQYNWPTVHHGFLAKGVVNLKAIDFVDRDIGWAVRRELNSGRNGLQ